MLQDNPRTWAAHMVDAMTVQEQLDTLGWGERRDKDCDLGFDPATGQLLED